MKQTARIALLVILLAALPLRGYAGVLTALCEGHHGAGATAQDHAHEHAVSHDHESSDVGAGSPVQEASVCSICASCCAGASLAPNVPPAALPQVASSDRIAFFVRRLSGIVPEHLDRPPLAS